MNYDYLKVLTKTTCFAKLQNLSHKLLHRFRIPLFQLKNLNSSVVLIVVIENIKVCRCSIMKSGGNSLRAVGLAKPFVIELLLGQEV